MVKHKSVVQRNQRRSHTVTKPERDRKYWNCETFKNRRLLCSVFVSKKSGIVTEECGLKEGSDTVISSSLRPWTSGHILPEPAHVIVTTVTSIQGTPRGSEGSIVESLDV